MATNEGNGETEHQIRRKEYLLEIKGYKLRLLQPDMDTMQELEELYGQIMVYEKKEPKKIRDTVLGNLNRNKLEVALLKASCVGINNEPIRMKLQMAQEILRIQSQEKPMHHIAEEMMKTHLQVRDRKLHYMVSSENQEVFDVWPEPKTQSGERTRTGGRTRAGGKTRPQPRISPSGQATPNR